MFENSRYILSGLTIIAIVVFCFLVYKIIKSNDKIEDMTSEITHLNEVILSNESIIQQLKKHKKQKIEKSDHETDYCNINIPIEVFDNKASEHANKQEKSNVQHVNKIAQPAMTSEVCTPKYDVKISSISNQINKISDAMLANISTVKIEQKPIIPDYVNSNIINLSDDELNNSPSTSSIIYKAVNNTNIFNDTDKAIMSEDKDDEVEYEDKDDEDDKDDEVEYEDKDDKDDEVEYEEEDGEVEYEDDEVEYEDDEDEDDEDDEDDEVEYEDVVDDEVEYEDVVDDEVEYEEEDGEVEYEEEEDGEYEDEDDGEIGHNDNNDFDELNINNESTKSINHDNIINKTEFAKLNKMSIVKLKSIAKNLKIKLSNNGHQLNKVELIGKIISV